MNQIETNYVILMDTVGDLPDELKNLNHVIEVPLTIRIDEQELIADKNLDTLNLLEMIKNCKSGPKTACPSIGQYLSLFENYKDKKIYVVCVSDKVSGSYSSAMQAKEIFLDENENVDIEILDSKTAACGQGLIAFNIEQLEKQNKDKNFIINFIKEFINSMQTIFVLEDLSILAKNGRLSNVAKVILETLHISPVLFAQDGQIALKEKTIGLVRAFNKMIDSIIKDISTKKIQFVQISHCNALQKALKVKESIEAVYKDIVVMVSNTGPCATIYAGNKGVIVSY